MGIKNASATYRDQESAELLAVPPLGKPAMLLLERVGGVLFTSPTAGVSVRLKLMGWSCHGSISCLHFGQGGESRSLVRQWTKVTPQPNFHERFFSAGGRDADYVQRLSPEYVNIN